ncbi:phage tail protein [Acanthopleuribacter pedis]|uniref:Tail fiber protein n=1 Tax=Acanthopleuribacter pedis TaxID=442870 RepID=A0A8J7Q9N7_9BACT|nr:tail fiber protein [Acanthopleuribacter pedis]MBO1319534.1 tail fiber protein [Acanthopleuribacter pedis]
MKNLTTLNVLAIYVFGMVITALVSIYFASSFSKTVTVNEIRKNLESEVFKELDSKALELAEFYTKQKIQESIESSETRAFVSNLVIDSFESKINNMVDARVVTVIDEKIKDLDDSKFSDLTYPIGSIILYASSVPPPENWKLCDGRKLLNSDYTKLHEILGSTFGSEGEDYFRIPDLRGRVPVGAGRGSNLSPRTLAQSIGQEKHTLTLPEIPSHDHSATAAPHSHHSIGIAFGDKRYSGGGGAAFGRNGTPVATNEVASNITINPAGGSEPHNNMQPSLVLNFIIKAK